MHPKPPRFVAAGRHHASIARPSNQDGPALEARVHAPLHRHEERVEVQVQDRPLLPKRVGFSVECRDFLMAHDTGPHKSVLGVLK